VPPPSPAAEPCPAVVAGYTPLFGVPATNPTDKYIDQLSELASSGDISKMSLFYTFASGCLTGVKPAYGGKEAPIGVNQNHQTATLDLTEGERFVEAEFKAGAK
jgi:hypothetical protein